MQKYTSYFLNVNCTSIPYWDERCGEYFYNENEHKNYVLKCQNCNSLFYEKNFQLGYLTDDENINKYTLNHYVLIGAGVDYGIFLLNQINIMITLNL